MLLGSLFHHHYYYISLQLYTAGCTKCVCTKWKVFHCRYLVFFSPLDMFYYIATSLPVKVCSNALAGVYVFTCIIIKAETNSTDIHYSFIKECSYSLRVHCTSP